MLSHLIRCSSKPISIPAADGRRRTGEKITESPVNDGDFRLIHAWIHFVRILCAEFDTAPEERIFSRNVPMLRR